MKQHRGAPIPESISWKRPETSYTHASCPDRVTAFRIAPRPSRYSWTRAAVGLCAPCIMAPPLSPCIIHHRSVAVAQRRTSRSFGMCFNSRIRAAIDGGLDVTVLAQVRSFINPQKRGHVGSDKERFGAAAELVPRVDRRALLHLRKARVQGSSLRRHLETP